MTMNNNMIIFVILGMMVASVPLVLLPILAEPSVKAQITNRNPVYESDTIKFDLKNQGNETAKNIKVLLKYDETALTLRPDIVTVDTLEAEEWYNAEVLVSPKVLGNHEIFYSFEWEDEAGNKYSREFDKSIQVEAQERPPEPDAGIGMLNLILILAGVAIIAGFSGVYFARRKPTNTVTDVKSS
jgi:hypothetical protein